MDWTRSLQVTWRYSLVDPDTWMDMEALDSVSSCSVNWDSSTETLLSGALEVDETFPEYECYVRAWCDATQSHVTERYPVATMLCQASKDKSEGTKRTFSVEAHSPLLELADDSPPVGWEVSGEVDDAIRLICSHMRAPLIEYESGVTLTNPIVAGDDDTWLTMLWAVLDAADLTMLIDGMGRLRIEPKPTPWALGTSITLSDTDERGVLWADMDRETSLFGIPNKLEVIWSGGDQHFSSVAINDDPSSPTSIPMRGRVVSVRETNPEGLMANPTQEAVDDYAQRRLRELSVVTRTYSLKAGYMPLWLGMAVNLELSKLDANEVACIQDIEIQCDVEVGMSLTLTSTRELWGGANG
jgi:hypothetical protein